MGRLNLTTGACLIYIYIYIYVTTTTTTTTTTFGSRQVEAREPLRSPERRREVRPVSVSLLVLLLTLSRRVLASRRPNNGVVERRLQVVSAHPRALFTYDKHFVNNDIIFSLLMLLLLFVSFPVFAKSTPATSPLGPSQGPRVSARAGTA